MRISLCAILIFLAALGFGQVTVTEKSFFKYTSPAGYRQISGTTSLKIRLIGPIHNKFASNIGFIWGDAQGYTLPRLMEGLRQNLASKPGTKVSPPVKTTLGGREASYMIITTNQSDLSSKQIMVVALYGKNVVSALFAADQGVFAKQLKTFQASLKSFKWLK